VFVIKRLLAFALVVLGVGLFLPLTSPSHRTAMSLSVRGVIGGDSSASGFDVIRGAGFNVVPVMPYRSYLDRLQAAGMKGVVWLWGYTRDGCKFWHTDDQIRTEVAAIAGHPAIAAYQIDDEPNYARREGCPQVVDQMRARHALVKSLDPSNPTYLTMSTWDGFEGYPYQYFAGVTDIMGLVVYPYGTNTSQPVNIDKAIAEAETDGVPRYWAVMQAYGDAYYRMPSSIELQDQLARWERSRMEGYLVYNWNQQATWMVDWCERHTYCIETFKTFNAIASSPTPTVSPTPAITTSPTPTLSAPPSIAPDTTAPTPPGAVTAKWARKRFASVTWTASKDNVGVTSYRVYRDGVLIKTTTSTSIFDRPGTTSSHRYAVFALDAAGNISEPGVATLDPVAVTSPTASPTATSTATATCTKRRCH
jgi:hypothetical protein